jgi:hypothetical protein
MPAVRQTQPGRLRLLRRLQRVQVADGEAVVLDLLLHHHADASRDPTVLCVFDDI